MGTSANPIGRYAIIASLIITALMIVYYFAGGGDGRVAFGISAISLSVAAFLYLVYARLNTVARTGYMSLLFAILVALMLPYFFLSQTKVNADRSAQTYNTQLHYAAGLYTTYCSQCHGLLGQGINAPQLNNLLKQQLNGNTQLSTFTSTDINRIITAGIPDSTNPTTYLMPQWGQDYNGPLNADDVNALVALISSGDSTLRGKAGVPPQYATVDGFNYIPLFLTTDALKTAYNNQLGALGKPKDTPIDLTAMTNVTMPIVNTPADPTVSWKFLYTDAASGQTSRAIQIKVGTTVTWNNTSSVAHSIHSGTPGHDSGLFVDPLINPGATYSFKFTQPGEVLYYCSFHLAMIGIIEVVP
jgi:plastocyanin/mono/diheme cytochrome c family protein